MLWIVIGFCLLLLWMVHLFKTRGIRRLSKDLKFFLAFFLPSSYLKNALAVSILAFAATQSRVLSFDLMNTIQEVSEWYLTVLDEFPVTTKSLTTGWMQFTGDYVAQIVEYRLRSQNPVVCGWLRTPEYDRRRGMSLCIDGAILSGPLLHYAFELMETIFPTNSDEEGQASIFAPLIHVFLNDYLVDTLYLAISFIFVAIVEGHGKDLVRLVNADLLATVKASWSTSVVLTPVEFICFRYFPVRFRVLFMNFVDIFWTAIVSFYAHRSRRNQPTQS